MQLLLRVVVLTLILSVFQSAQAGPRFLYYPFTDASVYLQQGWDYLGLSGKHCSLDYMKGGGQAFTVTAAADGEYWQFNSSSSWGKAVIGRHEVNGSVYHTVYAHCDSITTSGTVSNPQYLRAGAPLCQAGTTGAANGVIHLHFEVSGANYGGGCSSNIDPYDVYAQSPSYPEQGGSCGRGYLWTECPPLTPNEQPTGECSSNGEENTTLTMAVMYGTTSSTDKYDIYGYGYNLSSGGKPTHPKSLLYYDDVDGAPNPIITNQGNVSAKEKWLSGDINGDGHDDLVLITHPSSTCFKAHSYVSRGDGTLRDRNLWREECGTGTYQGQADHYLLGDVEGNGKAKLIVGYVNNGSGTGNDTVRWFLVRSDSNGGLERWKKDFGERDWEYALADVTGDGKDDLVGWNVPPGRTNNTLKWRVAASNGSSAFRSSQIWESEWGHASADPLFADVDGDGDADLILVSAEDPGNSSNKLEKILVATSRGSESGGFFTATGYRWFDGANFGSTSSSNVSYFVHDMNMDGWPDVVLYNKESKNVKVLFHNTSRTRGYFVSLTTVATDVDRGKRGAVRFGDFGTFTLPECGSGRGGGGYSICDADNGSGDYMRLRGDVDALLPSSAEWIDSDDCVSDANNEWLGISIGGNLTQAQCNTFFSNLEEEVELNGSVYWRYNDSSHDYTLAVRSVPELNEEGICFAYVSPEDPVLLTECDTRRDGNFMRLTGNVETLWRPIADWAATDECIADDGSWLGISLGDGLTQAECDAFFDDLESAVDEDGTVYWLFNDGTTDSTLDVMSTPSVDRNGVCFAYVAPEEEETEYEEPDTSSPLNMRIVAVDATDTSWWPSFAQWVYYSDWITETTWSGVSAGNTTDGSDCADLDLAMTEAFQNGQLYWEYDDGSTSNSLTLQTSGALWENRFCLVYATP